MTGVLDDLRYAARAMRRRPGFTAVAMLTLAVAIGGATSVYSVVDPLLVAPLPVPDASELVSVAIQPPDLGVPSRRDGRAV